MAISGGCGAPSYWQAQGYAPDCGLTCRLLGLDNIPQRNSGLSSQALCCVMPLLLGFSSIHEEGLDEV